MHNVFQKYYFSARIRNFFYAVLDDTPTFDFSLLKGYYIVCKMEEIIYVIFKKDQKEKFKYS